jgi:hypothetical protein
MKANQCETTLVNQKHLIGYSYPALTEPGPEYDQNYSLYSSLAQLVVQQAVNL